MTMAALNRMLVRLSRKPWNVKIHEAYRNGSGVVIYLARYLRGGPLARSRLVSEQAGQVVFRYRLGTDRGGDGKRQGTMSLPVDTFLGRWLEHVPPYRFQTVRGYGLYSGNQHARLAEAHLALKSRVQILEDPADAPWQQICESAGLGKACRCPKCGKQLVAHHEFKPGRSPPQIRFESLGMPARCT